MSGFTLSPALRGAAGQAHQPPLARALPGREPGESVPFQGAEAEIVSIEP